MIRTGLRQRRSLLADQVEAANRYILRALRGPFFAIFAVKNPNQLRNLPIR
jgi:hypothetical protein